MTGEKDELADFLRKYSDDELRIIDCSWKKYQTEIDLLFNNDPMRPTIMLNSPVAYKGKAMRMRVRDAERHGAVIDLLTKCLNNGNRLTFHSPERNLNDKIISIFFGEYHVDPSKLRIRPISSEQQDERKERYVKNYIIKDFQIENLRALLEAINVYPENIYTKNGPTLLIHMSWATCWAIRLDEDKNIKFLGMGIVLPTLLKENCLSAISHLNSSSKICRYSLAGESSCGQILAVHHTLICKSGLPTVTFLDTWKALAEDEKNMRDYFLSHDKQTAMLELVKRI